MSVAAIILAAGRSTRFENGHKLIATIDGVPMVRRAALAVAASKARDIALVVAALSNDIAKAAATGRWTLIENPRAQSGLASSLQAGLAAVPADASGAAIVLADMPLVATPLINVLIDAFEAAGEKSIVLPRTRAGRNGHPVIWPRQMFAELMSLEGDVGGKSLLGRYSSRCETIVVDDEAMFLDVDTRDDLERLERAAKPLR